MIGADGQAPDFSEDYYLTAYPDVAGAVARGQFASGAQHYSLYGRKEGRRPVPDGAVELRDSLIVTRREVLQSRLGRETLLVTGSSRGGTSLVAYTLLRLGYPLAADNTPNHEPAEAVAAAGDAARMSAFVSRMNGAHARWGFKLPSAALRLHWYLANLRNPVVLLVFRNPLAIARTIVSRDPKWGASEEALVSALGHGMSYMQASVSAIRSGVPTLLVDVDRAARQPRAFVQELAAALALTATAEEAEQIAAEIAVPGYKKVDTNAPPGVLTSRG